MNRSVSVVAWKSQAYPIPQEQHYGINGGEKKADDGVRQYMFLDDRRRKWVVGNRHFHFGADVVLPEDEEMVDYDPSGEYLSTMSSNTDSGQLYSTQSGSSATGHSANSRTTRLKKRSTRVYFLHLVQEVPKLIKLWLFSNNASKSINRLQRTLPDLLIVLLLVLVK